MIAPSGASGPTGPAAGQAAAPTAAPEAASEPTPITVALAEDSLLLREGLVRLFREAGFVTVVDVGDADTMLGFLAGAEGDRETGPESSGLPDVVVLDVRMPPTFRDEGVRAALEIRRRWPGVGILLLSQYVETVYARELLAAGDGGLGYLLKDRVSSLSDLQDAVHRIASGGTVIDPEVVGQLIAMRRDPLASITARERQVLELMAAGLTNSAIAADLTISVGAVEKNVTSIFSKLGLEDSGTEHRRVLAVLTWLRS